MTLWRQNALRCPSPLSPFTSKETAGFSMECSRTRAATRPAIVSWQVPRRTNVWTWFDNQITPRGSQTQGLTWTIHTWLYNYRTKEPQSTETVVTCCDCYYCCFLWARAVCACWKAEPKLNLQRHMLSQQAFVSNNSASYSFERWERLHLNTNYRFQLPTPKHGRTSSKLTRTIRTMKWGPWTIMNLCWPMWGEYPLVNKQFAIENGHKKNDLSTQNGDFP